MFLIMLPVWSASKVTVMKLLKSTAFRHPSRPILLKTWIIFELFFNCYFTVSTLNTTEESKKICFWGPKKQNRPISKNTGKTGIFQKFVFNNFGFCSFIGFCGSGPFRFGAKNYKFQTWGFCFLHDLRSLWDNNLLIIHKKIFIRKQKFHQTTNHK